MEPVVRELLDSPKLALHVRMFERVLRRERKMREQFYRSTTEEQKAEFINGEVIVHSPAKKRHTDTLARFLRILHPYVQIKSLGFVGYEKTLIALTRNDYEPDLCFFRKETAQTFSPDQARFPAPDFIAEVLSPSTEDRDRGVKFEDYAAHEVQEYWIIDPGNEVIEQYVLQGDRYALQLKSGSGYVKSTVVQDFEIPVRSLFDDEENLQVLQRLLQAYQA